MGPPYILKDRFIFKRFYRLIGVFIPFIACPFAPSAADTDRCVNEHCMPVGLRSRILRSRGVRTVSEDSGTRYRYRSFEKISSVHCHLTISILFVPVNPVGAEEFIKNDKKKEKHDSDRIFIPFCAQKLIKNIHHFTPCGKKSLDRLHRITGL
jgi:hypothetical protein